MFFLGRYSFLSNAHFSPIIVNGIKYPTVETAYQSFKTTDKNVRKARFEYADPFDAYHAGHRLLLRPDWKEIRENVMLSLLRKKFEIPELRDQLINMDENIVFDGKHATRFWGIVRGFGENKLGEMLAQVRGELQPKTKGQKSDGFFWNVL